MLEGVAPKGALSVQIRASDFRARLEEQCTVWSLPKELAADLERHLTPVTFERGALLFLRDSPADFLFWMLGGFAKLYLPHDDGNRTLVALAGTGDLLGFADDLTPDGRHVQILEAHALTRCSVGLVPREVATKTLSRLDPGKLLRLLELLNTTWSSMFEWYATFMSLPYRDRLRLVFKHLATRFGVAEGRGIMLLPQLTHEDLAEMIGSSRPMVSRLIGDMVDEGFLVRGERQHFVIRLEETPHLKNGYSTAPQQRPVERMATRFSKSPDHSLRPPSQPTVLAMAVKDAR